MSMDDPFSEKWTANYTTRFNRYVPSQSGNAGSIPSGFGLPGMGQLNNIYSPAPGINPGPGYLNPFPRPTPGAGVPDTTPAAPPPPKSYLTMPINAGGEAPGYWSDPFIGTRGPAATGGPGLSGFGADSSKPGSSASGGASGGWSWGSAGTGALVGSALGPIGAIGGAIIGGLIGGGGDPTKPEPLLPLSGANKPGMPASPGYGGKSSSSPGYTPKASPGYASGGGGYSGKGGGGSSKSGGGRKY